MPRQAAQAVLHQFSLSTVAMVSGNDIACLLQEVKEMVELTELFWVSIVKSQSFHSATYCFHSDLNFSVIEMPSASNNLAETFGIRASTRQRRRRIHEHWQGERK
jgi:hypothetical protein